MNLYLRIIGSESCNLDAPVQRFHATERELRCVGSFTIEHGSGRAARSLLRLIRLPKAGENLPTRLVITALSDSERWFRTFGTSDFVTEQRGRYPYLRECAGPIEFFFRLEVLDGSLVYHHEETAVRLGRFSVPLPRWLSPRIVAREWALPDEDRVYGSVRVTMPLIGLLIAYEGYVEIERHTV
jgi:hypothetical protein